METPDEPLRIGAVRFAQGAEAELQTAWGSSSEQSKLSDSSDAFLNLVVEVLSRDIRSYHRRTKPDKAAIIASTDGVVGSNSSKNAASERTKRPGGVSNSHNNEGDGDPRSSLRVVLEGVEVAYRIHDAQECVVTGGQRMAKYAY